MDHDYRGESSSLKRGGDKTVFQLEEHQAKLLSEDGVQSGATPPPAQKIFNELALKVNILSTQIENTHKMCKVIDLELYTINVREGGKGAL